ncbi:family 43 glycosyl hydrolase [Fimicolochytrium jonesii]|uniref:family 43 glycosyl hydrolase n=1 Tax=Fimicolochytrium jonesii TaxID=1396493 RepID=UPI0022FE4677|nr:family 43 glycosyl hydrolase [Fimicolochytrium jonesii]KAI8824162.1 family 43 glycosyl hydrolase [Fimicolochytrium jonesii]
MKFLTQFLSFASAAMAVSGVAAGYPNPGKVTGNIGVHDPSMAKLGSTYFVYGTAPGISIKTSTDRTNFRDAGVAFPNGLPWCNSYTAGDRNIWAPDVHVIKGKFYMYYSCSSFGSRNSAIFLATSTTGRAGSWTNRGLVIKSTQTSTFNAIDPGLVVDSNGKWVLTLGSFGDGIHQIDIDPATGLRLGGRRHGLASRPRNGGAVEGAYQHKIGNYWYLFVSFDKCCQGVGSTYHVMVGRSAHRNGPFLDRNGVDMAAGGGTEVLGAHGDVHGPGGQSLMQDVDGHLLVYHYYDARGAPTLGINKIVLDGAGWPVAV